MLTILKWTNTTPVIFEQGTFSPSLSLAMLFSSLVSNFIVSGVKSSRVYPVLILNVNLFSVLFTLFSSCFLEYT